MESTPQNKREVDYRRRQIGNTILPFSSWTVIYYKTTESPNKKQVIIIIIIIIIITIVLIGREIIARDIQDVM